MNFAKYRVQLSTEKSTRVSMSTSMSTSTPSLGISNTIRVPGSSHIKGVKKVRSALH